MTNENECCQVCGDDWHLKTDDLCWDCWEEGLLDAQADDDREQSIIDEMEEKK